MCVPHTFTDHGVLRLNCPAASTTILAMKKSIILISVLSVAVMALVSCAIDDTPDTSAPQLPPPHGHFDVQ
jgi:hypothetical protein